MLRHWQSLVSTVSHVSSILQHQLVACFSPPWRLPPNATKVGERNGLIDPGQLLEVMVKRMWKIQPALLLVYYTVWFVHVGYDFLLKVDQCFLVQLPGWLIGGPFDLMNSNLRGTIWPNAPRLPPLQLGQITAVHQRNITLGTNLDSRWDETNPADTSMKLYISYT